MMTWKEKLAYIYVVLFVASFLIPLLIYMPELLLAFVPVLAVIGFAWALITIDDYKDKTKPQNIRWKK